MLVVVIVAEDTTTTKTHPPESYNKLVERENLLLFIFVSDSDTSLPRFIRYLLASSYVEKEFFSFFRTVV
jgi:hypothetical protein